jgi:hypothetical protein
MLQVPMLSIQLIAQEADKRISPVALASVKYKDSYIKVTYGQPSKKKRVIFGGLVPYNEIWRTGANEATEITFTREVIIQGKTVDAGTYTLFTIPNPGEWTIVLNKDIGLWGSYNYNFKQDYNRWTVPIQKLDGKSFESLTIQFDGKNNVADLNICWDDICISLPIQFNEPKK